MTRQSAVEEARRGLYGAGVISEILLDMANADISGSRSIQGPSVDYLARRLAAELERIEGALDGCKLARETT